MLDDTYGHPPHERMFQRRDVYGIGYDEERAARRLVRLGIVGAGGVAQSKHLPAITRLRTLWEPVVVTAIAEPDARQGQKVAEIYGCRHYASLQQMLAAEALEGVLVLTPKQWHVEHAMACVEAGLPVLVEKPLTPSLSEAHQLCEAAERNGVLLMTVANKRYSPPYRRAKQLIEEGVIGTPHLLSGKFNLGYDYVDLLEDGTVHLFDMVLFLMGIATSLYAAQPATRQHGPREVDTVTLTLTFGSGAVGTLYTTALALSLKPWERVEVYGEHRWLSVEDQWELVLYDGETEPTKSWRPVVPNTLLFDEEFGGYLGEIENFLQAIRGLETPLVTGWDGYRACELVVATRRSLATGAPVRLPLSEDDAS
jgi:predicted dehydrogenase